MTARLLPIVVAATFAVTALAQQAPPPATQPKAPAAVAPRDPAARARAVTADVNARLAQMLEVKKVLRLPGNEFETRATGWLDASGLRKALAVASDDSGEVVDEYYLRDGRLVFLYRAVKGFEGQRQVTRVEHRFYFDEGRLTRWLGGMEKAPQSPRDAEWATEERRALEAAKALAAALR